jgi:uroporphyrinogen decarboxylase
MKAGLNTFNQLVMGAPSRLAMPIATYPGLTLTHARVCDITTNAQVQFEAQAALHARYRAPFVMSAMDLSAEAEAFGCAVHFSETEIPTITGRLVTNLSQAQALSVPAAGDKRTAIYLEAVRLLRGLSDPLVVLGGCIGPFSLAARLAGVPETLELTLTEPDLMHLLLEKCTRFLVAYGEAFKRVGADALLMAEPAAGLLSPRGLATFSSAYIKQIADSLAHHGLDVILHNCGAKLVHLPAILDCGLHTFHFGAPMDLVAALNQVAPDVVLCGNLDPASVFCQLPATEVTRRASALLRATSSHRNFVLSSGCDLPPNTPLARLDAFYRAVQPEPD